ncbi:hypothetical protein BCR34DRAFT_584482 [Clohesyomyces aquaticus]|uniref:Uncharacterized protein n=1 Tax=Clohesyomyces aquaticus TaxID=1231657 RepID=A0A1Y2A1D0_9PLEO|nr:hypothetical protein BCR34DRAFT_584482 [Clohesyomyces aquaticus]
MGSRYEKLNKNTQDLVDCMIPGIATNWNIDDVCDVIPEDIRMRKWDCDRREHKYDEPESDPRNWGVQFLKDLVTISRLLKGNLSVFQDDLRRVLAETDDEDHPWVRFQEIKALKEKYEAAEEVSSMASSPGKLKEFFSETSTDDSFIVPPKKTRALEDGHDRPVTGKRQRKLGPYPKRRRQSTAASSKKKAGKSRMVQDDFEPDNSDGYHGHGEESPTPYFDPKYNLRNEVNIKSEHESPVDETNDIMSVPAIVTPSFTGSPHPSHARFQHMMTDGPGPSSHTGTKSRLRMAGFPGDRVISELQLKVKIAEAELVAARSRLQLALQQRGANDVEGMGTKEEPHVLE